MLFTGTQNRLGRGFVVLSPPLQTMVPFAQIVGDRIRHDRLLQESQRLRGKIYLKDGAIQPDQLTRDGRHVQDLDATSWHLLTVDKDERVTACIRYTAHTEPCFEDLGVSEMLHHQPPVFSVPAERMVHSELAKARMLGFSFVELGGWVVEEDLRCSTEAIRMLLVMYSLSQVMGGAIALGTATMRHNSSSILRRIGGTSLTEDGTEVPPYFDHAYGCYMEMLRFDSRLPNPRYQGWIREFKEALYHVPIISSGPLCAAQSLMQLHGAVGENATCGSSEMLVA